MSFVEEVETVSGVQLLRLHTADDGQVWYGHDGFFAENSRCSVDAFFDRSTLLGFSVDEVKSLKVLGTRGNAGLIVKLHERRIAQPKLLKHQRILIGSPDVCPGSAERCNPQNVLHALWQPLPTSQTRHRWHLLTEKDYVTYAIIRHLADANGKPDEKCLRTLRHHPVWQAFSFLPGYDAGQVVRVIADVVDPRWFRDPLRPHRINRLCSYLGVTPENVAAYFYGKEKGRCFERYHRLLLAWIGRPPATGTLLQARTSIDDPRNFLHAIRAKQDDPLKGLLAASRRLVRFFSEVWIQEAGCGQAECGFQPDEFFKNAAEIDAFKAHRRRLSGVG